MENDISWDDFPDEENFSEDLELIEDEDYDLLDASSWVED